MIVRLSACAAATNTTTTTQSREKQNCAKSHFSMKKKFSKMKNECEMLSYLGLEDPTQRTPHEGGRKGSGPLPIFWLEKTAQNKNLFFALFRLPSSIKYINSLTADTRVK
jgi:hypothetical protein